MNLVTGFGSSVFPIDPLAVQNLTASSMHNKLDSVVVRWNSPSVLHGVITAYNISLKAEKFAQVDRKIVSDFQKVYTSGLERFCTSDSVCYLSYLDRTDTVTAFAQLQ